VPILQPQRFHLVLLTAEGEYNAQTFTEFFRGDKQRRLFSFHAVLAAPAGYKVLARNQHRRRCHRGLHFLLRAFVAASSNRSALLLPCGEGKT